LKLIAQPTGFYRISGFFFRVSQILRKKGKLVHFLFCGSYFWRFKTIYRDMLWHTITKVISTCFIFGELKMVAKNAKIRLPQKKNLGYTVYPHTNFKMIPYFLKNTTSLAVCNHFPSWIQRHILYLKQAFWECCKQY
jgi:hypothetical protein